jgi:hypothetical protein
MKLIMQQAIPLVNCICRSELIWRFTMLKTVTSYWFEVTYIKFVIKIVI